MSKIHWSKSAAIVVGTSLALWGLTYCAVANAQGVSQESASAAQAIAIAGGGSGSGSGAAQRTQRLVTVPGVAPPSFYGALPAPWCSGGGGRMGFTSAGAQWAGTEVPQPVVPVFLLIQTGRWRTPPVPPPAGYRPGPRRKPACVPGFLQAARPAPRPSLASRSPPSPRPGATGPPGLGRPGSPLG